jgi:hypothetical protein
LDGPSDAGSTSFLLWGELSRIQSSGVISFAELCSFASQALVCAELVEAALVMDFIVKRCHVTS